MKRSDLRRMIREEIKNVSRLNEGGSVREKALSPAQAMKIVKSKGGLFAYDNAAHSPNSPYDYRRGRLYITGIARIDDTKSTMKLLAQNFSMKYIYETFENSTSNQEAVDEIIGYSARGTGDKCPPIYLVAYDEPLEEDTKMFGYYCNKGIYSTTKLALGI